MALGLPMDALHNSDIVIRSVEWPNPNKRANVSSPQQSLRQANIVLFGHFTTEIFRTSLIVSPEIRRK